MAGHESWVVVWPYTGKIDGPSGASRWLSGNSFSLSDKMPSLFATREAAMEHAEACDIVMTYEEAQALMIAGAL